MKSVIVRNINDLELIDEDVTEVELINVDCSSEIMEIIGQLKNLNSLTFTKISNLDIEDIPKIITNLAFYNCDLENIKVLSRFTRLESLEITGMRDLSFKELVLSSTLKTISLNYSKVIDYNALKTLPLEEISMVETEIESYNFLLELKNLKKVIVDREHYEKYEAIMRRLENNGVLVTNIMGGVYRYV